MAVRETIKWSKETGPKRQTNKYPQYITNETKD